MVHLITIYTPVYLTVSLLVLLRKSRKRNNSQRPDDLVHGPTVAHIYELVYAIACHCDWITLLQLSNCNKDFRFIIQNFMRQQIRRFLGPYIKNDRLPRFFELLTETKAAVTGGLIHAMLASSSETIYYSIKPTQLELVVPYRNELGIAAWIRFLTALDFNLLFDTGSSMPYRHLSKRTVTMARKVSAILKWCYW